MQSQCIQAPKKGSFWLKKENNIWFTYFGTRCVDHIFQLLSADSRRYLGHYFMWLPIAKVASEWIMCNLSFFIPHATNEYTRIFAKFAIKYGCTFTWSSVAYLFSPLKYSRWRIILPKLCRVIVEWISLTAFHPKKGLLLKKGPLSSLL